MIASALNSARRMGRLVSDLLLLARADAGRTVLGASATLPPWRPRRSPRCAPSPTATT